MKTIVLPGYSTKNKEWAENVKKELPGIDIEIIEWQHWSNPQIKWNARNEAARIVEKFGQEKFNVIAKSLGTLVFAKLLSNNYQIVNKAILCGIPINDMDENDKSEYKTFSDLVSENAIVFQNSEDGHGNFESVRRFLSQYNPNIKIVEKPGSTHDYPYFEDFKEFLG
ncbi:hypothetical protein BH10PAT1_BH10PAT1_2320 [soil metagenome]